MIPTPYLFFNGQARAAATRYAQVFGVDVPPMMRMSDGPPGMDVPEDRKDWVMHCEMRVGAGRIFLSDDVMSNSPAMEGSSVMLEYDTAAEAKEVFDALAEGGEIRMAWEPTFWSAGFGTLTDVFGVRWMVGCREAPAH